MNETYGVKGRAHKLEQRKARAFSLSELPSLAGLRNLDSFDAEFAPSGQILRITNYNMAGNLIEAEHFVYDASGRTIRCIESDETGRETSLTDFVYESEGRRIVTTRKPSGELLGRIVEEYERGPLTLFSAYDHNGQLKREKSFQYAGSKLHGSDSRYYLPDGTLYEQWISAYDSQGRIASTYGLNAEGKPLGDGKYTYEYDDEGRKSGVWSFNEFTDDNVANAIRIYEYKADSAGNWIERREFHQWRGDSHWTKQVTTRNLTYYSLK